jgi:hypothetical protein
MQSHVVLSKELNSVFSAIFAPTQGANISIHDISAYRGLEGGGLSFAELEELAAERGDIAVGLLVSNNGTEYEVELCPPSEMVCNEHAHVIVLCQRA